MKTLPFEEAVLRAHDFGAMTLTMKMIQDALEEMRICRVAEETVEGMSQEWIDVQAEATRKTNMEAEVFFMQAAKQLESHLGIIA
jgi:hypothetical protein